MDESERSQRRGGGRGDTALHAACFMGHMGTAELLVDASQIDATSNSDGATPLMRAIEGKRVDVAKMLLVK